MLQSLKIENVAIIETAEIELSDGFNVLTGETGAGKSIIIDAINAVTGERTSREMVRTGALFARVTAIFEGCSAAAVSRLGELQIDAPDGSVMVQRSISADGKSNCRINGTPVNVSVLKSVGTLLVNIHGQHDSQALLLPETHCSFIDALADNGDILTAYSQAYEKVIRLKRELSSCSMDEAEKSRRVDMLTYQINELEAADIKIGERDELNSRRTLYLNAEKVRSSLSQAYEALTGSDELAGAVSLTSDAANCVSAAGNYFNELENVAQSLREMSYNMEEHVSEIRSSLESLEIDSSDIADVEERLDLLYRLSKKYGDTEEEMLEFLYDARRQLKLITLSDERINELSGEIVAAKKQLFAQADALSESRRKASVDFSSAVGRELEFLNMPGVVFSVSQERGEFTPSGADAIEFVFSANAGEVPKPLARIASGGELSRVMLAIKSVLSGKDGVDTLIFDEIDAGVSGRAAHRIGLKLKAVSRGRQVLCVTHLPQIAVFAQCHMLISKHESGGKTYTDVTPLDYDGRVQEIARLTGSGELTQTSMENAREMLEEAGR